MRLLRLTKGDEVARDAPLATRVPTSPAHKSSEPNERGRKQNKKKSIKSIDLAAAAAAGCCCWCDAGCSRFPRRRDSRPWKQSGLFSFPRGCCCCWQQLETTKTLIKGIKRRREAQKQGHHHQHLQQPRSYCHAESANAISPAVGSAPNASRRSRLDQLWSLKGGGVGTSRLALIYSDALRRDSKWWTPSDWNSPRPHWRTFLPHSSSGPATGSIFPSFYWTIHYETRNEITVPLTDQIQRKIIMPSTSAIAQPIRVQRTTAMLLDDGTE